MTAVQQGSGERRGGRVLLKPPSLSMRNRVTQQCNNSAMRSRGPALLFTAWAVHDIEEALTFPATCDRLADQTGIEQVRISTKQSWAAVGLMGLFVAASCWRGAKGDGRSPVYRAVVSGLEGHVYVHLAMSAVQRRYTAGVATALPIMLPGAVTARRELKRTGAPLTADDYLRGVAILIPGAIISQVFARLIFRTRPV